MGLWDIFTEAWGARPATPDSDVAIVLKDANGEDDTLCAYDYPGWGEPDDDAAEGPSEEPSRCTDHQATAESQASAVKPECIDLEGPLPDDSQAPPEPSPCSPVKSEEMFGVMDVEPAATEKDEVVPAATAKCQAFDSSEASGLPSGKDPIAELQARRAKIESIRLGVPNYTERLKTK